jgi:phosphopantetheinyl transferase
MLKIAIEELHGRSGHEAGRELLGELYREVTGEDAPEIAIADRGKPYFGEGPWHFSISHTKDHVFCALSDEPVGIDAEEKSRKINQKLAEKILSYSEKIRFEGAEDKRAALLRLWVLKEAAAKLTGEGLRGYPNHTDFSPDDSRILELDGCYVAVLEGSPAP